MSHTFKCKTKVKDKEAIQSVCDKHGFTVAFDQRQARTYSGNYKDPLAVINFPGWNYPFVITKDGSAEGDVYDSESQRDEEGVPQGRTSWGDMAHCSAFMQDYAREVSEQHVVGNLQFAVVGEEKLDDGWLAVDYEDPLQ